MAPLQIAVLAAGASTRMGASDKLAETLQGVPLLRLMVERALATGQPVLVTVPGPGPRRDMLEGLDARLIEVADASDGMAASFRSIGPQARGQAVMIVLADMPEIETGDMLALIDAWREQPDRPVRAATEDGTPGQPVVFPARLVARFGTLAGDAGARTLLEGERPRLVPLPGRRAVTDLDTPEDWAAWRAATGIAD
ncbi:nucleotidyltransferase family protein [Maribius pontilimi]|uniref:Nucleotidyltransferase family protein n=1 Tax=Palleronia pontilimi TaxID=1964209 RepID=A0A934ME04_9RHOB|nr:nucleotidyltransferase family protein [Palleronia pontilimi]MBJ3762931.1 nucleotidyltransferase family protein [Palleronia pontilimi]